jgi:glucose-induced degradation protein 8
VVILQLLDTNPSLYFLLQQQKLIEHIRLGRIAEAIQFAQDELAPRGEENPQFLAELEKTMALLAFESMPTLPSGLDELLSPAQRAKTAGEVNAAILGRLGQGQETKLAQLLKLMCWGEAMLAERADFPRVSVPVHSLLGGFCFISYVFPRCVQVELHETGAASAAGSFSDDSVMRE